MGYNYNIQNFPFLHSPLEPQFYPGWKMGDTFSSIHLNANRTLYFVMNFLPTNCIRNLQFLKIPVREKYISLPESASYFCKSIWQRVKSQTYRKFSKRQRGEKTKKNCCYVKIINLYSVSNLGSKKFEEEMKRRKEDKKQNMLPSAKKKKNPWHQYPKKTHADIRTVFFSRMYHCWVSFSL